MCQHQIIYYDFVLLFLPTGLVVVDCSASSETMGVLNQAVDLGCCIVLANKKPLTAAMVTKSISQLGALTINI